MPQEGDIPQLLPHQGCEHRTVNNGRITDKVAPHRFTDLPGRCIERQTQQIVSYIPNCEGQAEAVLGFSDFRKIFPFKPFQKDTAAQRLGGLVPHRARDIPSKGLRGFGTQLAEREQMDLSVLMLFKRFEIAVSKSSTVFSEWVFR